MVFYVDVVVLINAICYLVQMSFFLVNFLSVFSYALYYLSVLLLAFLLVKAKAKAKAKQKHKQRNKKTAKTM